MTATTSRVIALLNLLQSHRQWSGAELADRLGVTGRTLRRDIDRLRGLGYSIAAVRGALGGYRLEAGSALPPLLLTNDEAVVMAIGLRLAATQALADAEQTTVSALAKFEQVLPAALRERVNALAVAVQPQSPRASRISPELLGQLALASRDHERIRFHYRDRNGEESDRAVEPHGLVAAERHWFLVGWDVQRDAWRTFRVDRISSFLGARLRFTPRELPAADAAAFVSAAVAALRTAKRLEGSVVLRMPLAAMQEHFGPWGAAATAIDAERTLWPIVADSTVSLLSALAWVPAGVEFELRGSEAFLAFAREAVDRMSRAVRPDP